MNQLNQPIKNDCSSRFQQIYLCLRSLFSVIIFQVLKKLFFTNPKNLFNLDNPLNSLYKK